ncbi:hypothetical protein E8E14_010009 [Neopestalotiopsis sp. 37M]|nr:hypothetical protein E8E14_010009 [Neopestalotiopsis sp. 37M]
MASFTRFGDLPLELQREIWCFALLDPVRLPCVFRSHHELIPQTVDLEASALLHACSESRAMARSLLRFRTTKDDGGAALLEPYAEFDPDRDVLYIPEQHATDVCDPEFLRSWPVHKRIKRLALDEFLFSEEAFVGAFAAAVFSFRSLETLSLVFALGGAQLGGRRFLLSDFLVNERVWTSLPGHVMREDILPAEAVRCYRGGLAVRFGSAEDGVDWQKRKEVVVTHVAASVKFV